MNDASHIHSTPLAWVRDLLPDDGNLTPAQAMRRFGPPDLVAEMGRQVEIETARLFPPPPPHVPAGQTPWGRHVTELFHRYPGEPEKVWAEVNRLLAMPDTSEADWQLELVRAGTKSELAACLMELWIHLKAAGTAGQLLFSFQPTDPAAVRVTLPADRVRYLSVKSPGTLFEGQLAMAMDATMRSPAPIATLYLDGHALWHARIVAASEEVAIHARLAGLKQPPTDEEARGLAVALGVPHRAVLRVVREKWPNRARGRRRKTSVASA